MSPRLLLPASVLALTGGLASCAPASVGLDSGLGPVEDLVWVWGDLHAHSNWSYDGCENPDHECTHDAAGPGSRFFSEAAAEGLDFAALTDHAEADLYQFAPDLLHATGAEYDVWDGQQLLTVVADGGPVLPLLGYEWTAVHNREHQEGPGSHRTVILGAARACPAYRVAGTWLPPGGHLPEVGHRAYIQGDRVVEPTPAGLWQALDRALFDPSCEPVRWASFAHHPAYLTPQATDWSQKDNQPARETVVEIYSEHGSSECLDTSLDGCGWAINEAQGYHPAGSIQAALDRGFRLGFVGGTDGHDARPGSVHDGPSHVAQWSDKDGDPQLQFAPGGLTGLLVRPPLDRDQVLDALLARRSVATSGPRIDLAAWATGKDGTTYLPGQAIPRWNLPAGLVLVLGELDPRGDLSWADLEDVAVERVTDGGRVVSSGGGEAFGDSWDPRPDERWTYLRVRLDRAGEPEDGDPLGGEERIWLSPWFVEESGGCSTAGAGVRLPWVGLLLLLSRRAQRTKRSSATSSQAAASAAGPSQAARGRAGARATTHPSSTSRKGS